jgi:hypothetical protein
MLKLFANMIPMGERVSIDTYSHRAWTGSYVK